MTDRALTRVIRQRGMLIAGFITLFSLAISPSAFGQTGAFYLPDCNDPDAQDVGCLQLTPADIQQLHDQGYPYYVGHAEPTAEFFSTTGTSGYNMQWKFQLPATEPSPTQDGSNVANFELYAAFWMGLALCDPNSNPFGPCVAISDSNDPSTAGAAFLELQFFPPGSPFAFGTCSNTEWCALLHINTRQNATTFQNTNCPEPTTAAFVTTDGTPGGPKLFMSNGDTILVTITDTSSGLRADVNDMTSSTTGFMIASGANGFKHNANQTDCSTTAFDFHAMYATASPGQVVPWAGLRPNVAFNFEIGHFELCGNASCSTLPDSDGDDTNCGTHRGVGGCIASETDHDGTSYLADWPDGTSAHPATLILGSADDRGVGPLTTSISSPSNYDEGYPTIAFRTTEGTFGAFYPFFSQAGTGSSCRFNFGNDIPGTTTDDFGGVAQYGTTIDNPCLPGTPPTALCKDVTVPTDPNVCTAAFASIDNGSFDSDGDPVTLSPSPGGPYPLGTTPVTLTVTEPEGASSSCAANVTVVDLQKPNISCPAPTVECTSFSGAAVALSPTVSDNCPGIMIPSCVPPSGSTFPLGSSPFSCSVKDASGNSNSCTGTVKVIDTTPPVITSASASPNVLWPPDHKMVPVTVAVNVTDVCSPTVVCKIVSVTSNEPILGPGSGNTSPDWQITGNLTANLRAERAGGGTGRVYTLTIKCTDPSNNSSTKTVNVTVPHSQ